MTRTNSTARLNAWIDSLSSDQVVLRTEGNKYRLHLSLEQPITNANVGDRIAGIVEVTALRIHGSSGGGIFIEPVEGAPRIVAGRVMVNDAQGALIIRSVVPLLVTLTDEGDRSVCTPGSLVNFHVESGARFVPSA